MNLMMPLEEFRCAECNSTRFLSRESGENICLVCGFVNIYKDERMNVEIPNGFVGDVKKNKPPTNSKSISNETMLNKWNRIAKVSDSTEKNLINALTEMTRLGDELSVSIQVLEKASNIYRKLVEKHHVKGHKIDTLCAAAIYISCRQLKYPTSLGEIAKASDSNKKDIGKKFRFLIKKLNIKVSRGNYITSILPTKKFTNEEILLVEKIIIAAKEKRITIGKNPNAITASAYYIASLLTGIKITQRELSETYQITQTTIRNRYNEIQRQLMFSVYL